MNAPLPGPLNDNPQLDRWVAFPAPGKVTVLTGRVELGQGVLTAMAQIAADELDVSIGRITMRSGDTEQAPNEGYTAGSQSIQFGGVAMRQACADVRALFLEQAAKVLACKARRTIHSRRQHLSRHRINRTGLLDTCRRGRPLRQSDRKRCPQACRRYEKYRCEQRPPRSSGQDFWRCGLHPRHAARRDGACPGRAPAEPRGNDRHDQRNGHSPRGKRPDRIRA